MFIPFHLMPDTARLWVYAGNRAFTEAEINYINATAPDFLGGWSTHGTPLEASYQIVDSQFLLLSVNEGVQLASGCSIDSSMAYIRMLEKELNLALTDRSLLYFMVDGEIQVQKLPNLKEAIARGAVTGDTTLVNTLVASKGDLASHWKVPAADSWLKRYFRKTTA